LPQIGWKHTKKINLKIMIVTIKRPIVLFVIAAAISSCSSETREKKYVEYKKTEDTAVKQANSKKAEIVKQIF
jgi:hypothetical protein